MSKVHPRVRDLQEPLQSLRVGYFLDGGSISINMVDARGTNLQFAVPSWHDGGVHKSLFIDTLYHDTNAPGVQISEPAHTARHLQAVLHRHVEKIPSVDFPLAIWRNRTRGFMRVLWRKATRRYDLAGGYYADGPLTAHEPTKETEPMHAAVQPEGAPSD